MAPELQVQHSNHTVERVYADLHQGRWWLATNRPTAEGHVHFRHAVERARLLGDDAAFAAAAEVAAGVSNREIAEALVISEGTAEVHVKPFSENSASSPALRSLLG